MEGSTNRENTTPPKRIEGVTPTGGAYEISILSKNWLKNWNLVCVMPMGLLHRCPPSIQRKESVLKGFSRAALRVHMSLDMTMGLYKAMLP